MRSKKTVLALLATFLPAMLAVYYRIAGPDTTSPELVFSNVMLFFLLFMLILVALFYGTALIADEVDNRSIICLLTRPVRKCLIVLSKFAAYMLQTSLVLIPPVVLVFLALATDNKMSGNFLDKLSLFGKQLWVFTLALAVYGSIFTFLGTRLKRPVLSGLLFAFGWEKMVLVVPGIIRRFSVVHYLLSVFPKDPSTQKAIEELSRGTSSGPILSTVVLLSICAVFLGLSVLVLYRREYRFE